MEALVEIERELAEQVGPVARVLVRRAARGLTTRPRCGWPWHRPSIRGRASGSWPRRGCRPPTLQSRKRRLIATLRSERERADRAADADGDIDKAAAALATSLGPIARVVAGDALQTRNP
jgi:serine/threonine-protein kinase